MFQKILQNGPYVLLGKAAVLTVNHEIFWRQMAECQCQGTAFSTLNNRQNNALKCSW